MPAVPSSPRVKLRSSSRRVPRQRAMAGGAVLETDPEPNMRLSRAVLVMLLLHVVAIGGMLLFAVINEHSPKQAEASAERTSAATAASAAVAPVQAAQPDAGAGPRKMDLGGSNRPNVHVVRAGETLTRIANQSGVSVDAIVAANGPASVTGSLRTGQELKLPPAHPATNADPANSAPKLSAAKTDALQLIEGSAFKANIPPAGAGGSETAKNAHLPPDSGHLYTVGKGESPISIAHKLHVSYDALVKLNQIDDPKKLKPGQKLRVPAAAPKVAARH